MPTTSSQVDPAVVDAWCRGIAPPTRLTVSQWAERHRVLSPKSAAEPGPWRNARTPYLVEIMDRLSLSDPARVVVIMAGAQLGKTEAGSNWLGYVIQHSPAPTMMVLPTEEMARRSVSQRVEPMIADSPELKDLVTEPRAKENGSRQFLKQFPGGILLFAWANSPSTLRSMPAQNLFFDEVDAPVQYGEERDEGDFIELALARSRTFARRKALIVSTPTLKRTSRIGRWFRKGDQREYRVPCPFCGVYQALKLAGLKWDHESDGTPITGTTRYVCEACAQPIDEARKAEMLPAGVWTPTARGEPRVVSYHLPSLYSPLGWLGWEEIARLHAEAHRELRENRDPSKMKVFVNTIEAREWDDTDDTGATEWSAVMARSDPYDQGTVPRGAYILTAGVDVQDDRLEVSVYGWGPGEESWLVEHDVLVGDPGREEVWKDLDGLLAQRWATEDGRELPIVSAAIDTGGHHTQDVYGFARTRRVVMAIKGANVATAPLVARPTLQDVNWRGAMIKGGVQLWAVGVHAAKKLLARRLKIAEPGPGRLHTPTGLSEDFYQQLCGEKLVVRHTKGTAREEWVKTRPSQRVEAWDCLVYAYAAAVRAGLARAQWNRLAQRPPPSAPPSPPAAGATPAEGPPARTIPPSPSSPRRRRVTRSSFLGG